VTVRAYVRASLRKQEASPSVQTDSLEEFCKLRGWPKPLVYVDKATTSRIPLVERDAGAQLCNALDRGDRIVITKLDRAFRSTREFLTMMEHWQRIGVEVHIMNFMGGSPVDFSSPVGKMCVSLLAVVAEFERDIARERTKETMAWARRQGGGGGQPCFGFKHVKVEVDGQMKRRQRPDPEERKQMREILRLRTEDPPWSWDEIRQEFNYVRKWSRTKKWGKNSKKGREWTMPALMRACKAEIVLQHREAFSKREGNSE
jgi:DNA invertase Pin-like site-specific DNA recombinase